MSKIKFEIGKNYVVKMKSERHVEVLHEYSVREKLAKNIGMYSINTLKILLILCGLICPPLLFLVWKIRIKEQRRGSNDSD